MHAKPEPHESGRALQVTGYDPLILAKFFLSFLWRASITDRDEFSGVELGSEHESEIGSILRGDQDVKSSHFAVVLQRFGGSGSTPQGVLIPAKSEIRGVTYYQGLMPNRYKVWVKVDPERTDDVSKLALGSTNPILIAKGELFEESDDFKIMVKAAKKSN